MSMILTRLTTPKLRDDLRMQFIANFMSCDEHPVAWAQRREAEGWDVLGCADHLWSSNRPFPHVWVTLGAFAAATTRPQLTTSFANNLLRSPVEFALASLQMQQLSGGRFEAGLGAGWSRAEIEGIGDAYPSPGQRVERYREAIEIVRTLLTERRCTYEGRYYNVDVPKLGPVPVDGPPPLVASLGGRRSIREIAPLVDRVELKMISAATKDGALDLGIAATIPRQHVADLVAQVREVNPTVPLGVFVLCSAGDDATTRAMQSALGDSFAGGFHGPAAKVAESMMSLAEFGIDRIQVSPYTESSFEALAEHLPLTR
jgi:alkanesulfonate monooxygenase SsuD/methylene tetrahydromethanopterin reductase-like flavin-dependent oxidoreductase (luciferase family)